jgi:glycerophosphoryl diester phosphodiesterase
MEEGAVAIETDLRVTREGRVVIMHDRTVDRTTNGSGPVRKMTLAQLLELDAGSWFDSRFAEERIPTLEGVFECLDARIGLVLDTKECNVGIEEEIVRMARAHRMLERVTVSSRIPAILRRIKELEPAIQTSLRSILPGWGFLTRWTVRRLEALGAQTVSPYGSLVTKKMVMQFHDAEIVVRAWGVGSNGQLATTLIQVGVDGMTYNDPHELWNLLRAERDHG